MEEIMRGLFISVMLTSAFFSVEVSAQAPVPMKSTNSAAESKEPDAVLSGRVLDLETGMSTNASIRLECVDEKATAASLEIPTDASGVFLVQVRRGQNLG
jgi:hypothetical protein